MKIFARLIQTLDQTTKTNVKVAALETYFRQASDEDRIWALALLSGRAGKRQVSSKLLRTWAGEAASLPPWLFEESYHVVGDLAETIALLLHEKPAEASDTLNVWMQKIKSFGSMTDIEMKDEVLNAWKSFDMNECFVFNKLITGNFRIGVSQQLVIKALASLLETDANAIAHRLMGNWNPETVTFQELLLSENQGDGHSRPYPFFLAHPVEDVGLLGDPEKWQAEWKWDGIRGQIVKRNNSIFIWSRGEELVTDKFPEVADLQSLLPEGTVLDGELLSYQNGQVLPFNVLQTRIGRKNISAKILQTAPVVLLAYDVLEYNGEDIRNTPLWARRKIVEKLVMEINSPVLLTSSLLEFSSWEQLAEIRTHSRANYTEGIMLKEKESVYGTGRKRGPWWKWKIDPLTIDAVLLYAQRGHGRRANMYTDYTFAVWDQEVLVPFAKAYSGLTDKELGEIDHFIKKNTLDKFGPVRSVVPELVFEIAFEGINASQRHKCGVALRFPRIYKWRRDKKKEEANTLENLKELLELYGNKTR
jgi:DNA ligase-1